MLKILLASLLTLAACATGDAPSQHDDYHYAPSTDTQLGITTMPCTDADVSAGVCTHPCPDLDGDAVCDAPCTDADVSAGVCTRPCTDADVFAGLCERAACKDRDGDSVCD